MKPIFDFSEKWDSLSESLKKAFTAKCRQIERDAIEYIAVEKHMEFNEIEKLITPLDPEWEWDNTNEKLPADITWIEFEIQFMKEELAENGVI